MPIGSLFTPFVVPPLNLVLLALLALALPRNWMRLRTALLATTLTLLLILAVPIVGDALIVSVETGLPLVPSPSGAARRHRRARR